MKGTPRHYIRKIISRLTALGYILDNGCLSATSKAKEVLFGGVVVTIRGNKPEKTERTRKREEPRYAMSEGLFAKLKQLRLEIARGEKVPAFVIFSDATLVDMCQKHPRTEDKMLDVSGVGQVKLERYGKRFLHLLMQEEPTTAPKEKPPELTAEMLYGQIEEESLQISRVADNISAVLIRYGEPKISGMKLNSLLIEAGYLEAVDGVKLPTEIGRELGIRTVERQSNRGSYTQCLFGADAQRVCVELILKEQGA